MSEYKENLYSFASEDGISIPGWRLVGVDYENSVYTSNDGFEYSVLIFS